MLEKASPEFHWHLVWCPGRFFTNRKLAPSARSHTRVSFRAKRGTCFFQTRKADPSTALGGRLAPLGMTARRGFVKLFMGQHTRLAAPAKTSRLMRTIAHGNLTYLRNFGISVFADQDQNLEGALCHG